MGTRREMKGVPTMARNGAKPLDLDPLGPVPLRSGAEKYLPPSPEQIGQAAALAFIGIHTDETIAKRLGISRRTLSRWKLRPEWAACTAALVELYRWPVQVHLRRRGLPD